jgi:hypothetical protein
VGIPICQLQAWRNTDAHVLLDLLNSTAVILLNEDINYPYLSNFSLVWSSNLYSADVPEHVLLLSSSSCDDMAMNHHEVTSHCMFRPHPASYKISPFSATSCRLYLMESRERHYGRHVRSCHDPCSLLPMAAAGVVPVHCLGRSKMPISKPTFFLSMAFSICNSCHFFKLLVRRPGGGRLSTFCPVPRRRYVYAILLEVEIL